MADEKTEQEVAAQVASGDNDTGVTDDMLNAAAADAVTTETETEQVVEDLETTETTEETVVEQETTETDEEGLPADHAKRSDLGRKLSAIHRRQDDSDARDAARDARLDKVLQALETQTELAKKVEPDPLDDLDPDEPMTKGEIDKYLEARDKKATQQTESYNTKYFNSLNKYVDDLGEGEKDAIIEELKVLPYDPSTNPDRDAETNFFKAERAYLRKRLAGPKDKKNPITGKQEHSAIGTITNQKVVTKETTLPKLDAAGMSYLAFVESEDGSDKAQELHKSLGKG